MSDATAPPGRRQDPPGEEDIPPAGGSREGGPLAGLPPGPSDPCRSPDMGWSPWTAPVALVGGLVLAAALALIVDLPATLLFGVSITQNHTPPGIELADTIVQDVAFVLAAVYCAHIGGRAVRAWQLGLRPPGVGWKSATGMLVLLLVSFLILSLIWAAIFNPKPEKLLEQLGTNETTSLLLLSAGLTCVVAPICEELLFRGFIFTALRGWRGTWLAAAITGLLFGAVHAGSAPALDLVPLAALGFGLCLLYRYTGSLYPCIVAHSLNNSLAFAALEGWGWQAPVLMIAALASIGVLVLAAKRIGLIVPEIAPESASRVLEASAVGPST
jgi:membrane protease YdiL (CAAX protease family)